MGLKAVRTYCEEVTCVNGAVRTCHSGFRFELDAITWQTNADHCTVLDKYKRKTG